MTTRARILFWVLPEAGHLNPSLRIAATLADRGHEVAYVAPRTIAPRIEAAGHRVIPWFDDLYDDVWADRLVTGSAVARRRAITERYSTIMRRLERGEGAAADIRAFRPDVVVSDVNEPLVALLATSDGVPVVNVCTSLPQTRDPGVPPVRGVGGAQHAGGHRFAADAAWWRHRVTRTVSAVAVKPFGMEPPYRLTEHFAGSLGIAPRRLDPWTVFFPQLVDRPELVLCPEAFDVPRPHRAQRYYVESASRQAVEAVTRPRGTTDLSIELPPGDGPLVYCSLGTQRYRADRTPALFSRLVEAFDVRPERRLVLSLGQHLTPAELGPLPANVVALPSVPQVELLREADVMITHGGLGTVKECIVAGVPMLAIPLALDQHANAHRVELYGLGRSCSIDDATTLRLNAWIDELVASATIRTAVEGMQRQFLEVEGADRGADVVEAVALRSPLPPNAPLVR